MLPSSRIIGEKTTMDNEYKIIEHVMRQEKIIGRSAVLVGAYAFLYLCKEPRRTSDDKGGAWVNDTTTLLGVGRRGGAKKKKGLASRKVVDALARMAAEEVRVERGDARKKKGPASGKIANTFALLAEEVCAAERGDARKKKGLVSRKIAGALELIAEESRAERLALEALVERLAEEERAERLAVEALVERLAEEERAERLATET